MTSAVLRWCEVFAVAAAVACVGLWAASASWGADVRLAFDRGGWPVQVAAAGGTLILCDHLGNRGIFDSIDRKVWLQPAVTGDRGVRVPGFRFRRATFANSAPVWSLDLSLLIPAATFLAAGYLARRFRTVPPSPDDPA